MEKMKFYSQNEIEDRFIGKKGSAERDKYENDIEMYRIGKALKQARLKKNLTQEELGKMVGVQKAQISRIENGRNLTFATVIRLLKAMGFSAKLEVKELGDLALC